jgi:hypothetical protein
MDKKNNIFFRLKQNDNYSYCRDLTSKTKEDLKKSNSIFHYDWSQYKDEKKYKPIPSFVYKGDIENSNPLDKCFNRACLFRNLDNVKKNYNSTNEMIWNPRKISKNDITGSNKEIEHYSFKSNKNELYDGNKRYKGGFTSKFNEDYSKLKYLCEAAMEILNESEISRENSNSNGYEKNCASMNSQ